MADMHSFDMGIFDEQVKITTALIHELNRLRGEVNRLAQELALQAPTIWEQQERICTLESLLSVAESGEKA